MQKIIITGRVGRDAELRHTQAGKPVLNFSIATDTGYGDNKKTIWHKCAVWGDRAEKLAQHVRKGAGLYIEGEVTVRAWKGNDGESKADLEVFVKELEFTGGGKDTGQQDGGYGEQQKPATQQDGNVGNDLDTDLPF